MTLREQLIRDEGLRLKPYQDTEGKWTIGVGRNLSDVGLTYGECEYLLENDIVRARAGVLARIDFSHRLDEVRREALVNMAFNLGINGLLGFKKFLTALEMGDWAQAAHEMLDSKWHQQVGLRAERLAEQIRSGTWQ